MFWKRDFNLTTEQKKQLEPVLKSEVWIACANCGQVFLKTTAEEFAQTFDPHKPSKEYIEAMEHNLDSDHVIIGKMHGSITCLSAYIQNLAKSRGLSKEDMRRQLLEVKQQ